MDLLPLEYYSAKNVPAEAALQVLYDSLVRARMNIAILALKCGILRLVLTV